MTTPSRIAPLSRRRATAASISGSSDVLASTTVVRYALSFDGLVTKVNHHKTVSEYFTPEPRLRQSGFDRLVRLALGVEDTDDVIACLNWALHHHRAVDEQALAAFRRRRRG